MNIIELVTDFVDKEYPEGDDNRGFAITILTTFLLELEEKYCIKKKDDK